MFVKIKMQLNQKYALNWLINSKGAVENLRIRKKNITKYNLNVSLLFKDITKFMH